MSEELTDALERRNTAIRQALDRCNDSRRGIVVDKQWLLDVRGEILALIAAHKDLDDENRANEAKVVELSDNLIDLGHATSDPDPDLS